MTVIWRHRHCAVALFLALRLSLVLGSSVTIASAQTWGSAASLVVPLDHRASESVDQPVAEQELLVLLNSVRAQHGLAPLRMDTGLRSAARDHSHEMATGGYVGHGSLSGGSTLDRLSHVVAYGLVGENVTFAIDYYTAHRALVSSSGHLQNILDPRFHRVGIGVFSAGSLGLAVTQDFAE